MFLSLLRPKSLYTHYDIVFKHAKLLIWLLNMSKSRKRSLTFLSRDIMYELSFRVYYLPLLGEPLLDT